MGINPPDSTYSDLPGTETQTPAQDLSEARYFPSYQQPIPRIPSIPAVRPQGGAAGGGLNMDTLMPLLLMAAPFLEAHQPGYGLGLVHGVLQHQQEQATARRNTIMTMANEFKNTSDEDWPVVAKLLETQGLDRETIATIKGVLPALRGPDYAQQQYLRKIQAFLAPELTQMHLTGKPFDPTQMSAERLQAFQTAFPGELPRYGVENVLAGVTPGQPGAGELGMRTPPIAPQPIMKQQVVERGAQPIMTVGQMFPPLPGRPSAQGTPYVNIPVPPDPAQIKMWEDVAHRLGWYVTPEEEAKHKKDYQEALLEKAVAGLRNPGSVDFAQLRRYVESPEAGGNFNVLMTKAMDLAAEREAKLPKPESIVLLNTRTGEQQTLSLPPGAKLHTYSPPNAPTQHLLIYPPTPTEPNGHREWLPPGVVPTHMPPPISPDKVSPADKEVLSIFFNANSYAQLKTRPQAEQDAFGKRFQEALKHIGVNVPPGPTLPPAHPFWDAIKNWLGMGTPSEGAAPPAGATPPKTPTAPGTRPGTIPTRPLDGKQVSLADARRKHPGVSDAVLRKAIEDQGGTVIP